MVCVCGGQASDFLHTVWTDGPLRGPGVQPPLAVWGIPLHVSIAARFSFYVLKLENGRAARWEWYGDFLLTEKTEAGTLLPWGPPPGVNLSQITPDTCHGQQWLLCEARRLIFSTEGKQKPKHRGHPACSCRLLLTLLQVDDPGPFPVEFHLYKIGTPAGFQDQSPRLQGCDQTLVCLDSVGSAAQGS